LQNTSAESYLLHMVVVLTLMVATPDEGRSTFNLQLL